MRGRRRLRLCRRTRIGEKQAGLFTFAPLSAQFFDKQDSVIFSYMYSYLNTPMMLLTLQYIPQTVFFFLLGNNETASRRKDRKFRLPTMQWPTKVKTSQNRFTFTGLAILVQTERTTKQSRDYPFFSYTLENTLYSVAN